MIYHCGLHVALISHIAVSTKRTFGGHSNIKWGKLSWNSLLVCQTMPGKGYNYVDCSADSGTTCSPLCLHFPVTCLSRSQHCNVASALTSKWRYTSYQLAIIIPVFRETADDDKLSRFHHRPSTACCRVAPAQFLFMFSNRRILVWKLSWILLWTAIFVVVYLMICNKWYQHRWSAYLGFDMRHRSWDSERAIRFTVSCLTKPQVDAAIFVTQ